MECPNCHSEIDDEAAVCPRCGAHAPNSPVYDSLEYAAFISYRHDPRDAELVRRLHTALETYRLPKGIAGPPVAGAKPRRLGRVFRDEDELGAAESLPDRIREALKRSSSLVVICSPATLESTWVSREIETFISFHGRERVFLVLAQGEPAESVPPILFERTEVDAEGTARTVPAEPLAADFRSSLGTGSAARKAWHLAVLRIASGIVGCRFDDLRQRDRARRRRRKLQVGIGAATLALVLGATGVFAHQQHQSALVEESKSLAAQAEQLFSQGDRYGAIRTALSALPSEDDPNHPITDEATQALADALEVYPDSSTYWRSSYSIDMPATIQEIAVDLDQNWFALLDAQQHLNVYDAVTGKLACSCALPQQTDTTQNSTGAKWHILAVKNGLIAAPEQSSLGSLTCFDPTTGATLWSEDGLYCHALAASSDGKTLGLAASLPNEQTGVSVFDVSNGKELATVFIDDGGDVLAPMPAACTFGASRHDFYFATDRHLFHVDIPNGKSEKASAAFPYVTSLFSEGGHIFCSSQRLDENADYRKIPCAVEAFDGNLHRLWNKKGSYRMQTAGNGSGATGTFTPPLVHGASLLSKGKLAIVASAGSHVHGYAPKDGEELFDYELSSTMVGVGHMSMINPGIWLKFIAADGSLVVKNPLEKAGQDIDGAMDTSFPCSLEQAQVLIAGNDYWVAIGQSADDEKQLLAYHTDYSSTLPSYAKFVNNPDAHLPDSEKTDYSAEELVELAHEVLGE